MSFTLTSNAFKTDTMIPAEYTCDGAGYSPELSWHHAPANTQSFVLIVDDPDAPMGTWYHWLVFNIPATVDTLPKNLKKLPTGSLSANNSWHKQGYGGPCPPSGTHRYFFKLYALDTTLQLPAGASKQRLDSAMRAHILTTAVLIGKYMRQ